MAAIGLLLAGLAAIVVFLAQPNWDWFRPTLTTLISSRLHRPVRIDGHLQVHLFSWTPGANIGGLKIGEPAKNLINAPKENLAEIDSLSVQAELMPLFIGRIVLPRVQIDRPNVVMFQDKDGHANWDFSDGSAPGQPTRLPPIKTFIITDGHLTLTNVQRHMTFKGAINARENTGSDQQAFALTGDGSLNNKIFRLNATGGPLLNVRTDTPYPFDMTVQAGDTQIIAKGRVTHPFNLGQVEASLTVKGHNLTDLYDLTGLTLPNTSAYQISAMVQRNEQVYAITRINGRIGNSDLEGTLKVDTGHQGRPYLSGDLRSRVLDFKDMGTLFGATAANRPNKPMLVSDPHATRGIRRVLPDVPLDIDRMRGMDAQVSYRALSVRTGPNMPLREVHLGINLDHGLLILSQVTFNFPQGSLAGTARIDARGEVQHNAIDFSLTGLRVQDFAPKIEGAAPLEGLINARIRATGNGNSVHKAASTANGELTIAMPGGTIRQSFAELMGIDATKGLFLLLSKDSHQTDVRCAVADFQIDGGIMQANNIIFDTGVVSVKGSGIIDLKDESLGLAFKGKPKAFRLVRVNAPILIGGHLSAPTFGVDLKPALLQGGIALVLKSILPFTNLDTAKDANCTGLMLDAHAKGTPNKRLKTH